VKRRLVLTSVAVCLLGLAVFFVPTALTLRTMYHHADVLELQRELAIVIQQLPAAAGPADVPMTTANHQHHRYAQYNAAGQLVSGNGPVTADPVVRTALAGAAGEGIVGDEVVAALPLHAGSAVTGAVRAAEPSQEGTERLLAALFRLSLLAAAALGAAAGGMAAVPTPTPTIGPLTNRGRRRAAGVGQCVTDHVRSGSPGGGPGARAADTALRRCEHQIGTRAWDSPAVRT